jgi:serine/threonine protein kinase
MPEEDCGMRGAKYLRDARHVDKFMYTLNHELFYEPFEKHYIPAPDYIALVTDLVKNSGGDWMTAREGLWFYVHPRQSTLPIQGWKVHVSATTSNGKSILERVTRIALANGISFKFALDKNILSWFSSKRWRRGGAGKFITMYPSDVASFKDLLEKLYLELRHEEGPYILSDRRYKDCRVLYYRYGGIARTTRMDVTGEEIPVMISPEGEAIPDVRTPYFAPPAWAADPFPAEESHQKDLTLNQGKYRIKKALAFSNSGGVYLADDLAAGVEVVIKEARAHSVVDSQGIDAIQRLKKEQDILALIQDTRVAPRPLDSFHEWENFFVVEEFVDGTNVRELMLTKSPLTRVRPTLEDSREFYEIFRKTFKSCARAVDLVHQHRVVLGDLSATNIKIDPLTHEVRLIDFEGSFRLGIDEATYLYTPGFKNPLRARQNVQGFEDDLYSLAVIMLYMMFPVGALSSLRTDLFDGVLKTIIADIGWSQTEVFNIIRGLATNQITSARVCELLDQPAQILPPRYSGNVESESCGSVSQELGNFILANMRLPKSASLFPADPFMYQTNPLSLGFGACGVLYALKKSGFEIPNPAYDWLESELDHVKPEKLPPGLLTGASGIAWTLSEIGREDRAAEFMKLANQSAILKRHHSYLHGMAGIGMANLYFHVRTQRPDYLAMAIDLADSLLKTPQESDKGIYWENDKIVHLGFGYGQSGVALFLLRLFQLTGKERFLAAGKRALMFDLSHGIETESQVLSFPRSPGDTTLHPYLEEGSAGIAKVAMRYGMWDQMDGLLAEVHRKYAGFPGFLFGLASFIDVLTDAYLFSNDPKYLDMAKRPLSGLQALYLIKQPHGIATPGDGLFRISCDYATGAAGVMRTLHRYAHLGQADFMLDEVAAINVNQKESAPANMQQSAISTVA